MVEEIKEAKDSKEAKIKEKPSVDMTQFTPQSKDFGVRPSADVQLKPKATGARYKDYERWLVTIKLEADEDDETNNKKVTRVISGKVIEMTSNGSKKLEPGLVEGSRLYTELGLVGMNQDFIVENKTPIQIWFPKGAVSEGITLKATSEKIKIAPYKGQTKKTSRLMHFFEYKGGETLKSQIERMKKEFDPSYSKNEE